MKIPEGNLNEGSCGTLTQGGSEQSPIRSAPCNTSNLGFICKNEGMMISTADLHVHVFC